MKKKLVRLLKKEQAINRKLANCILHMVRHDGECADDMPPVPEMPGLELRPDLRHYR